MKNILNKASIIVIKIGSSLLIDSKRGELRMLWLKSLVTDIVRFRSRGQSIVLVSSGAIGLGRQAIKLGSGPQKLEINQAAAAAGQIRLAHAYQESLAEHGIIAAQVLLTADDTESRRRYLNARSTLNALLQLNTIPVVNENDTVATDEIRYGDNDRLAARVAQMVSAEYLILLSDIDGLYSEDPSISPNAEFIPEVTKINPEIEKMAGSAGTTYGSGGMVTKIAAARIAIDAGCHTLIADGNKNYPLTALESGNDRFTWFKPTSTPLTARKNWIAGKLQPLGNLTLDDGAIRALIDGKSLLPAGVTSIKGNFQRGDAVILHDPNGLECGKGLTAYSAEDAHKIIGHKSDDIEKLLGYRGRDEMIHRDDLVLTGDKD